MSSTWSGEELSIFIWTFICGEVQCYPRSGEALLIAMRTVICGEMERYSLSGGYPSSFAELPAIR